MQPLGPPDSVSFIFLFSPGPGDRWGMEVKQVSGGDSHRGYEGGRALPTGRGWQHRSPKAGPEPPLLAEEFGTDGSVLWA